MQCRDVREQLGLYLDGEIQEEARAIVEAHLARCPACSKELRSLRSVASALAPRESAVVPAALWTAIEERLDQAATAAPRPSAAPRTIRLLRRPIAAAASIVLAVGLGLAGIVWLAGTTSTAEAASVDFGVLLDALPLDARKAFRKFLVRYDAQESTARDARQYAPDLNFAIPDSLPGGFKLEQVYTLRFGGHPGVAATYVSPGDFLAVIFHPPVRREQFGSHQDYPCVIGKHRGHKVSVGEWKLVHVTDPTTCHCILSRLDEDTELPPIVSAVAPGSAGAGPHAHDPGC
jgi:hypothetical protein